MARRGPAKKPKAQPRTRKPRVEMYETPEGLRLDFLKLSPRSQYGIIAGVRGPDAYGEHLSFPILKTNVTARIRSIVFVDSCPGDYCSYPLTDREMSDVARALEALKRSNRVAGARHYVSHLYTALCSSYSNPVWGGHGDELLNLMAGLL